MRLRHIGAVGIVAALALTGCSESGGADNQGTQSADAGNHGGQSAGIFDPDDLVLSTPAGTSEVDHVTWGLISGEPRTLDPVRVGTDSGYITMANMCETLLSLQSDFSFEPGLASSAKWKNDTTFVIELREDVTFWDGAPMTAEDVAYSLKRAANPKSQSIYTAAFTFVDAIKVTGNHQVTITFKKPDSQFRNAIAGPAGYIFQKEFADSAGESIGTPEGGIMCTGPFELKKWTPGQGILTVAHENYWGGEPLVKELEFKFVTNGSTLANALLAGEIDGAFHAPAASAESFINSDTGSLFIGPSTGSMSFGPMTSEGPAADPRVRAALDLAIDKSAFIETVLNGYGAPLKTFVPPFVWQGLETADIYRTGYEALPDHKQDLERAQQLIEEANLTDTNLRLVIPAGNQQARQTATIIQAAGEQLGLTIEIKQLQATEFAKLFYDPSMREGYDFVATTGYITSPSVLEYPNMFVLEEGLFNWSEYSNSEAAKLLDEARTTTDPVKTAKKFVEAQALYAPDRLQVSLASQYTRVFLNNDLTGVTTSFSYIASPWALNLGGK